MVVQTANFLQQWGKVNYVRTQRLLSAKFETLDLPPTYPCPQKPLGIGHILAQLFGSFAL